MFVMVIRHLLSGKNYNYGESPVASAKIKTLIDQLVMTVGLNQY
jgi:hypothetical protein